MGEAIRILFFAFDALNPSLKGVKPFIAPLTVSTWVGLVLLRIQDKVSERSRAVLLQALL